MSDTKLTMTFEANTIKHLGVKMYSNMPPALAELIANAYDACATEVHIKLYDDKEKKVVVQDNGAGMSFDQVNDYFLRIGRNRRDEDQKSLCGRIPTGKKGLGKLALFGIGDTIEITTCQGEEAVTFTLSWDEILHWKGPNYEPKFKLSKKGEFKKGTIITLTNLKRISGFPIETYTENIASLFDFRDDFTIFLSLNDADPIKIDSKLKYKNIQPEFTWDIRDIVARNDKKFEEKDGILGTIMTTETPLKAHQRGITLFANGRMVNNAEFFGPSESSHFYSYATGWINIDFIDNWKEDVISTNRQSIDWENESTILLREYLASCIQIVERLWREDRKNKKQKTITDKTKVDIKGWLATLPDGVQQKVETIVNMLDNTPELSEATQQTSIQLIHDLVPEYPNLHWRHIHPELRNASEKYYQTKDYYTAFIEALKRYIAEVSKKSGMSNGDERALMQAVWGGKKLLVAKKYKKSDGTDFNAKTITNIEEGQRFLSEGIVVGGRHPVQHEEHKELSVTGLFSEKDCLDFLSMLSHLFKRLEDSEHP